MLVRVARAHALLAGRDHVRARRRPGRRRRLLAHRIVDATNDDLAAGPPWVAEFVAQVPVPRRPSAGMASVWP